MQQLQTRFNKHVSRPSHPSINGHWWRPQVAISLKVGLSAVVMIITNHNANSGFSSISVDDVGVESGQQKVHIPVRPAPTGVHSSTREQLNPTYNHRYLPQVTPPPRQSKQEVACIQLNRQFWLLHDLLHPSHSPIDSPLRWWMTVWFICSNRNISL